MSGDKYQRDRGDDGPSAGMPDAYDRLVGALDGLPGVVRCRPTTVELVTPLIGAEQSWIVTTVRQAEEGDYVFIKRVSNEGGLRLVLPPKVVAAIVRQRDAITEMSRRRAGKTVAAAAKARGEKPGFMLTLAERKQRKVQREARAKKGAA